MCRPEESNETPKENNRNINRKFEEHRGQPEESKTKAKENHGKISDSNRSVIGKPLGKHVQSRGDQEEYPKKTIRKPSEKITEKTQNTKRKPEGKPQEKHKITKGTLSENNRKIRSIFWVASLLNF